MGKSSQESDRKTIHCGSTTSTTCGQLRLRLAPIPPILSLFFFFLPVFPTTKWIRFPSLLHSTSSCPVLSMPPFRRKPLDHRKRYGSRRPLLLCRLTH